MWIILSINNEKVTFTFFSPCCKFITMINPFLMNESHSYQSLNCIQNNIIMLI